MTRPIDLVVTRWGARFRGRRLPCAIGRGGIRADKREGDGATPVGAFRLEAVLFRPDRTAPPRGEAEAVAIGPGMLWSDDPGDGAYNALVMAPHGGSAETLRRADPIYDLVGVLDHNRHPSSPGMGSAIFLHAWRKPRHPTEGCVAFAPRDLRWILDFWSARGRVVIQP